MDAKNNASTTDTNGHKNSAKVQRVTKKSSDELLRKFAELGSAADEKKELRLVKRMKRSSHVKAIKAGVFSQWRTYVDQGSSLNGASVATVERKCLLPSQTTTNRQSPRQTGSHRRLGIVRARDTKHNSILCAIEKTWRRTIEGASRVFMEKQYNRHTRLTTDMN